MLNLFQTKPHDVTAQKAPFLTMTAVLTPNLYTTSSSYIFHGVGPLVDPFRSHVSVSHKG